MTNLRLPASLLIYKNDGLLTQGRMLGELKRNNYGTTLGFTNKSGQAMLGWRLQNHCLLGWASIISFVDEDQLLAEPARPSLPRQRTCLCSHPRSFPVNPSTANVLRQELSVFHFLKLWFRKIVITKALGPYWGNQNI